MPSEVEIIRTHKNFGLASLFGINHFVLIAVAVMKIENENKFIFFNNGEFFVVMLGSDILVLSFKNVVFCIKANHTDFELVQKLVPEEFILN